MKGTTINTRNNQQPAVLAGAEAQHSSQQDPRLENIFHNIPGPLILTDRDGHIRKMNHAARRLLGEPSKDMLLAEWPRVFGLYTPDGTTPFQPENLPPIRALRELGDARAEDILLRSMVDGREHRISMLATPVLAADGAVEGVATLVQDLTFADEDESLGTKNARHVEGIYRFSSLLATGVDDLDRIADSVASLASDVIGGLSALILLEPDTAELRLVSFHDTDPAKAGRFRELVPSAVQYSAEGGLEAAVMSTAAPVLISTSDHAAAPPSPMFGEFIQQEQVSDILMVPLIGRAGAMGAIAVFRQRGGQSYTSDDRSFLMDIAGRAALAIENRMLFDSLQGEISARLSAAQALNLSEERFQSIFDSTSLGIKILDLSGNIVQTNPAFQHIMGYSGPEILGRRFYDFLHPADIVRAVSVFQKLKKEGASAVRFQHRAIHKNGSIVWVNAIFSGVRQGGGDQNLAFIVSILEDVTEQKNFEAEMAELKGRLQSTVELERLRLAHELHDGPMQALYSVVYELEELRGKADAPFGESLGQVTESIHAILNELRETATQLRPPTISQFGLEKTIRSYVADLQEKHPELRIHLSLARDHQLLPEEVRLALFRVLQQSLTNIIRHADATDVRIRFSFDAEEARLEVSDNGKGFRVPSTWIEFVREGHYGLAGSAERVNVLGGIFVVESQPLVSTSVKATIPWKEHLK